MSGLPLTPVSSAPLLAQRDAPAPSQAPPGAAAALVRTQTEAALQQATAARAANMLSARKLPLTPEKPARLVGPPPAFDVNVLQDLLETRATGRTEAEATEDTSSAHGANAQNQTPAYAESSELHNSQDSRAPAMDLAL